MSQTGLAGQSDNIDLLEKLGSGKADDIVANSTLITQSRVGLLVLHQVHRWEAILLLIMTFESKTGLCIKCEARDCWRVIRISEAII